MCHVWGKGEVHADLWSGNLSGKDRLEDLSLYERIILKTKFNNWPGSIDRIGLAQDGYE
jgi:hypothetical protein